MEYIQADIWVRFQRMRGNVVHFVCADDAHGAPIMSSRGRGYLAPGTGCARHRGSAPIPARLSHRLRSLVFDGFAGERGAVPRHLPPAEAAGLIYVKAVEQFYDPVKAMFLADRYIKGECPNCHAKDQYADACEVCSIVNSPTDLIDPYSTLSGAKPLVKTSDHYFFRLSDSKCVEFLKGWRDTPERLQPASGQQGRANGLTGKGDEALGDWDISRDAPYFGIPIPTRPANILRVAGTPRSAISHRCRTTSIPARRARAAMSEPFAQFLAAPDTEQLHFIGKTFIYFHTLFWPAMLKFAGPPYRCPITYMRMASSPCPARRCPSRAVPHQPAALSHDRDESGVAALLTSAPSWNSNVEDLDFESAWAMISRSPVPNSTRFS